MRRMRRLFGTDGVRGVANVELTPELALVLGRAAGDVLDGGANRHIVVGRDTRVSGPMLQAALMAGLCSAGTSVRDAGVLPTPAVAFLALEEKAVGGAVVSASHNPVEYNGIKFFSDEGVKVAGEIEDAIEARATAGAPGAAAATSPVGSVLGTIEPLGDAIDRYIDHLLAAVDQPLTGLRVVLDCAHGAAWRAGPRAFREAGAEVAALHAEPDGARINVDCGSTSPHVFAEAVVSEGADAGFAFDGDADRVIAVDERGNVVDGDRMIGLAALHLKERAALPHDLVVVTVMSNLGFRRALEEQGIHVATTQVGDRFVAEEMSRLGAAVGGEQSGHVIFGEHSSTGDGILTALKVSEALAASEQRLSDLAGFFVEYPQILVNVPVGQRDRLDDCGSLWEEVRRHQDALGDRGRVLVRASGTEPVVRVMVEAEDAQRARAVAEDLADHVKTELA